MFDIPNDVDSGVLKDEEITLCYGENKKEVHKARRIAYWDSENKRLFEFIANNFELTSEKIMIIYKKTLTNRVVVHAIQTKFPLKVNSRRQRKCH